MKAQADMGGLDEQLKVFGGGYRRLPQPGWGGTAVNQVRRKAESQLLREPPC